EATDEATHRHRRAPRHGRPRVDGRRHPVPRRGIGQGQRWPTMKAVIPAAGAGTRFLPLTKNSPKEMLPLLDKPAIQYVVEEAVQSGCDDILIITGRGKRAIEDHFDRALELEAMLEKNGDKAA